MKKHLLTAAATAGILFTSFGGFAEAASNTYTVQSGDTLWKISQTNNVSITNLKTWNNLTSDTIYVNETLLLNAPTTSQTAAPATSQTNSYTVKAGDTLWGIATAHNMTVTALKSLNGLTSDTIHVGQILQLTQSSAPIKATSVSTPTPVSKAQQVIDEAKKYIGTPYVWGGESPSGFDCSGFAQYVFSKVGISIPRTCATQFAGLKAVSTPNPGDLVYFQTYTTGASHVGIYLGNNQMIDAGSNGVTITNISTTYWKSRYLGARTAF